MPPFAIAKERKVYGMLYLGIAAVIILLDQLLKAWVVHNIPLNGAVSAIPGLFHLTYVKNTGAAFSILRGQQAVLLIVTVICVGLILWFLFKGKLNSICKLALAFVLGGAVGNAIDRVCLHYVVDMIEVEFMRFAVFNLADCFVVVGGIGFCLFYFIYSTKLEKQEKALRQAAEREKDRGEAASAEQTSAAEAAASAPEESDNSHDDHSNSEG